MRAQEAGIVPWDPGPTFPAPNPIILSSRGTPAS
jgi:hypothetical protein